MKKCYADDMVKSRYVSRDISALDLDVDIDVNVLSSESIICTNQGFSKEDAEKRRNLFLCVANRIHDIILNNKDHLVLLKTDNSPATLTRQENKDKSTTYTLGSNACYYTIIAKTEDGLVMNKWGINVRLHDHAELHKDTREEKAENILNGENDYDYSLSTDAEDRVYKVNIKFSAVGKNTRKFTLRLSSELLTFKHQSFNSELDPKFDKCINSWLTQLWELTKKKCESFDYRGYIIHMTNDNKYYADDVPVYNNPQYAVTIGTIKSVIDYLKGSLSNAERYIFGTTQYIKMSIDNGTLDLHILENIELIEMNELNDMCAADKWFKCTDIFFACDYCVIVMDIIDSDSCRISAEVAIDDVEELAYFSEQKYIAHNLVEDVLNAYIDTDYFDWGS